MPPKKRKGSSLGVHKRETNSKGSNIKPAVSPEELLIAPTETTLLKCKQCTLSLSVFPVYMNEDETFVCGRCPLDETKNPVRQLAYEYVAKQMKFQCSFTRLGCPEELFPRDLVLHEASCVFRKVECAIPHCNFSGPMNAIQNHFNLNHPQLILNRMVEISTEKAPPETVLIVSSNNIFKLFSIFTENILTLSVAFMGAASTEFECTLLRQDKQTRIGTITIQPDVRRCDATLNYSLLIPKEGKLWISVDKIVPTKVEVAVNTELEHVYDKILESLRCPVCTKIMVPPIVDSSKGSTCNGCAQISTYSTYKRNTNLEHLTTFVRYYCQFEGCNKKLIGSAEKVKHEMSCSFVPIKCTFCGHCAVLEEFIDHLKQHADHVVTNNIELPLVDSKLTPPGTYNNYVQPCSYKVNQHSKNSYQNSHSDSDNDYDYDSDSYKYYMIRSQCVFEFMYNRVKTGMHRFTLYLRGPMSCNDKFDFVLTLKSNDRNNNKNMKFRLPCETSKPGKLILPDSLIRSFVDGPSLPVHVDIIDKSCQMLALT